MVPDILANAGGVTVSYFEWVQDLGRLFWDREEIRSRLADKMMDAFDRVWSVSAGEGDHAEAVGDGRGDPRGRRRARGSRDLSERRQTVRDAMVSGPTTLGVGVCELAGAAARANPGVRAVLVVEDGGGSSA